MASDFLDTDELRSLAERVVPDADVAQRERHMALLPRLLPLLQSRTADILCDTVKRQTMRALGSQAQVTPARIDQLLDEATAQLRLCLTADWLENFRRDVESGVATQFPDRTYFNHREVEAGKHVTDDEKVKILQSAKTQAAHIARETGVSRDAVAFILKSEGKYTADTQAILDAHEQFGGNAKAAARELGVHRSRVMRAWDRAGLPRRRPDRDVR